MFLEFNSLFRRAAIVRTNDALSAIDGDLCNYPLGNGYRTLGSSRYSCRSLKVDHLPEDTAVGLAEGAGPSLDLRRLAFIPEYRVYNRERELERQERERKEKQWEEELNTAMKGVEERLK